MTFRTTTSITCLLVISGLCLMLSAADSKAPAKPNAKSAPVTEQMPLPEYDAQGALIRPTGYEKWIVVGTSIGLGYSDGDKYDAKNPGQFHNVYVQPAAFDHFVDTGEFPEQTVFVVTNLPSKSTQKDKEKTGVLRSGFFADHTQGLEVSIKDSKRFPDGWAYFMFHDQPGKNAENPRDAVKPIADRKDCYNCHAEHGAVDHVFTQYYSVLTNARTKNLAEQK